MTKYKKMVIAMAAIRQVAFPTSIVFNAYWVAKMFGNEQKYNEMMIDNAINDIVEQIKEAAKDGDN